MRTRSLVSMLVPLALAAGCAQESGGRGAGTGVGGSATAGTQGGASGTAGTQGSATSGMGTQGSATSGMGTQGSASGTAGTQGSASGTAGTQGTSAGSTGGGSPTATHGAGGPTGSFEATYMGRSYMAYVPPSYMEGTPSPVVVLFHGLGDDYANFFNVAAASGWTAAADEHGFVLVVPAHQNPSRPSFLHLSGNNLDAAGTQAELDDVLDLVYYGIGATHNLETTEIYYGGFSEGGLVSDIAAVWYSTVIHAVMPFAGGITNKPFPLDRDIPVYFVCGQQDPSLSGVQAAYQEWVAAGHPANSAWVAGVGHLASGLWTQGPSPSQVFDWVSTQPADPVESQYMP